MFDFLFSGWFWGFILIMVATGSIIKSIFKVKFSLFLTFILIMVIFFIINLFNLNKSASSTYFSSDEIIKVKNISEINQYNCAFCNVTFDFTRLDISHSEFEQIEINNLMGKIKVLINKTQKIKILSRTFLGSGKNPDGVKTILGNHIYFTSRYSKSNPHTTLHLETIFGSTEVYEK